MDYKIRITMAALFALLLTPGMAQSIGLEIALGVWSQKPSGDLAFKPVSGVDDLSIGSDLGYDREHKLMGRLKLDSPLLLPNVYLMATPMKFSGTGSKDVSFHFGDITFEGNAPVNSSLRFNQYDLGLYYSVPGLRTVTAGILNFELGVDARLIDFDARVTGEETITGLTVTESESRKLVLPMLYLGIQVKPLQYLVLEGEARGVYYRGDHIYDYMGRVKLKPFRPFFASVGYRYEDVKIEEISSDIQADTRIKGLTAELGVEF